MSDNIEDYEITPEDLGCLGEPECDPGVKDLSGEQKTSAPKSFKYIPFEVKKRARKLYDSFDNKDMPFEDFCIELYALESPKLMQADLTNIVEQKHERNRNMVANLHNIGGNLN